MMRKSLVRFACVGGAATLVHFLTLTLLVEKAMIGPAAANGMAFLLACWVTFIGQSFWVFPDADELAISTRLARFFLVAVSGVIANSGLMLAFTGYLDLSYRLGFLLCVMIIPVASFVLSRLWVFSTSSINPSRCD